MIWRKLIYTFIFLFSLKISAFTLDTLFLSMDLPDSWACQLENSNWICRQNGAKAAKQGLILVTAKQAGPEDTLAAYKIHLGKPKQLTLEQKIPVFSKVIKVREIGLAGEKWIESVHLNSEAENFYSYYFATVKNGTAILISLTAHRDHFERLQKDFIGALKTMRLKKYFPTTTTTYSPGHEPVAPAPGPEPLGSAESEGKPSRQGPWLMILSFILVTLVFSFVLLKGRKGRK